MQSRKCQRETGETVTASAWGTAFKKDGVFNGRVDKERVREFMEIVADIRKGL